MNRARAIKKDYQKILKALPQDNPPYNPHNNQNRYNLYQAQIQHSPDQKVKQICHTMAAYNQKYSNSQLENVNSLKKYQKKSLIYNDRIFAPLDTQIQQRYRSNKKYYNIQQQKRIKTLQRSIQLNDRSYEKSFGSDKFKKKDLRPLNNRKQVNKNSPYIKKLNRQSLNVSRQKTKSNIQSSNKNMKNLNSNSKEDTTKIRQLKLNSKSEIKIMGKLKSEQQLMIKGKQAYQKNQFTSAIQTFNIILIHFPHNIQAIYFAGVSYLAKNQYFKALKMFDRVIELNQTYNKNVYILSAIALKKMSLIDQSFKKLSKCISIYPDYYDAYIYRGKILLKQKKYSQAKKDFQTAIGINKNKTHGYIGRADSLMGNGQYQLAYNQYQNVISIDAAIESNLLLKQITCLKHMNKIQQGLVKVNKYLEKQENDGQGLFMKGYFLQNLSKVLDIFIEKYNQASMIFEQILNLNDKKLNSKTLQQMIKIKIMQRDFYSAYHLIQRIQFMDIDKFSLQRVKLFTEAVLFLMKRKYAQSIQIFQQLNKKYKYYQKDHPADDQINYFLKPLFHLYSAYGYFCLSQFKTSLDKYSKYHQILIKRNKKQKILQSSYYNKILCQALLQHSKKQYLKSIEKFVEASLIYPNKVQPYFYQGIIYIKSIPVLQISEQQTLLKSLNMFSKGIQVMGDVSNNMIANVYYHRSLLYSYLSIWNEAISDIDKAIQKSQDNIPKYFYLRALIFGCCQSFKQAIHDVSICLSLNDAYPQAYLLRSKCLQIEGEANEAFLDLQRYITLKPEDPLIHKYAGHLLFQNGAFQDSILAYAHGEINEKRDTDIFLTRGKAYFLLGQFKKSHQDMMFVYENTKNESILVDSQILQLISEILDDKQNNYKKNIEILKQIEKKNIQGKIFKKKQFYMLRGTCYFYLKQYNKAIQQFEQSMSLKEDNLKNVQNDPEDLEQVASYCNHMRLNISLCYIMLKNYGFAKQKCQQITVQKEKSVLEELINLINYQLNQPIQSNIQQKIAQLKQLQIFSLKNKLSKHFPNFKPLFKLNPSLEIKLCFSFPKVQPPQINPQFDKQMLMSLDPAHIQNKPQAPWIRRSQNCIMFTSTIQIFDNLDLQTQERTKRNELQRQYPGLEIQNQFNCQSQNEEQPISKKDLKKLRDKLKLQGDIEKKLNRLIKKQSS